MSIEKKTLISNRRAVKKANVTKVNTGAQVATVAAPKLNLTTMKSNSLVNFKLHK